MHTATIFEPDIHARRPPGGMPAVLPRYEWFDCNPTVVARPLIEGEWDLVRAFIHRMAPEDLRSRFGHPIDFSDEATIRRFFDVRSETGEIAWVLDETAAIAGISHRIMVSREEAEIGLIVRSDRKRRGIGECLLPAVLARAARQGLDDLRALVLRDNRALVRLAAKIGYVPRAGNTFAMEIAFVLR
jgi:GNAT superfamily N-acetyltransferase